MSLQDSTLRHPGDIINVRTYSNVTMLSGQNIKFYEKTMKQRIHEMAVTIITDSVKE